MIAQNNVVSSFNAHVWFWKLMLILYLKPSSSTAMILATGICCNNRKCPKTELRNLFWGDRILGECP